MIRLTLILFIALSLGSCQKYQKGEKEKDTQESKAIKSDSITTPSLLKTESNLSEIKEKYPSDTLTYRIESDTTEIEYYFQELEITYLSDSSIWFSVEFENPITSGIRRGIGIDKYSELGLETDEYEGISYLAIEYWSERKDFTYSVRLSAEDSSKARVTTSSEIATDVIPMDFVMSRVTR